MNEEAYEDLVTGEFVLSEYKEVEWSYLKVMMIVEDGDVAYRLGVGTIHKDAWDQQKPTTKSFRLC